MSRVYVLILEVHVLETRPNVMEKSASWSPPSAKNIHHHYYLVQPPASESSTLYSVCYLISSPQPPSEVGVVDTGWLPRDSSPFFG